MMLTELHSETRRHNNHVQNKHMIWITSMIIRVSQIKKITKIKHRQSLKRIYECTDKTN